jgi:two-component sensor histidine kinase/PAS domain-containing protein
MPARLTRWIEGLPSTRMSGPVRLAITLGIVALAWKSRALLDSSLPPGFPYLTFFPAVILTGFMFGVRLGSLSALLCGLIAWYYFIPPLHSFTLAGREVALGLYVFVVGTDLALIHGMQIANQQLRRERQVSRDLVAANEQAVAELQRRDAERLQAMEALRESEVKTHLATETAGIGLWQWNVSTGAVRWDNTMFDLYGITPTPDGSVHYSDYIASLHPDDAAEQDRVLAETVRDCTESLREFRIIRGDDGTLRHLRAVEVARAGPDGRTEWVVGTNLDITEQKQRERHVQLLLGEVNHRAKNLLAVVLSVAKRTSGADHATFMANFAARIRSLAAGQDLLVMNEWKGVQLDALIRTQLGHFKDLIGERILLSGDDVALSSSAVQAIGMALHELVTNASKYGALSTDMGRVMLDWRRVADPAGDRFVMTWTESGGPAVIAPTSSGFGSVVTGEMVAVTLDAEVASDFAAAGFRWTLDCPISNIREGAGA